MSEKLVIDESAASSILQWINTRNGVLRWTSADLSDPSFEMLTPATAEDGDMYPKPHWKCTTNPCLITDPAEIEVVKPIRIKSFHVGTRMGSQGLKIKVTDGGTRKINRAIDKARLKYGHAWYEFDYGSYENVVIYASGDKVTLDKWTPNQNATP